MEHSLALQAYITVYILCGTNCRKVLILQGTDVIYREADNESL